MTSKLLTSIAALTALAVLLTPPVWASDGKAVSYRSDDETVSAMLYAPPGSGPFPALIAIHAIGGLDDWVKEQASKLAGEGYLTLAVDLYRGKVASGSAASMAEAREIARSVPAGRRERDLQAAFDFLLTRPDVLKDRIGAIGWCIGGSLSIRLASLEPGLKVVVAHYPTGVPQDFETLTKIKAPVLLVLGGKDTIFPLENGRRFEQEMKSLGKRVVTIVYPDTGHAFEMPWSSQGYRPEDSADAWKQTIAFLHETSIVGAELGSKDSDRDCNAAAPTLKQDDANHAQDEAAIRKMVSDVQDAWNRRDPQGGAAAAHLTKDYDHINVGGHWTSGKVQVEKVMSDYFQTHNPPPSVHTPVERIRFITPEVAICVVRNQYSNDKRTWEAMSTLVLHKMNGEWWNEAFQNTLVQSRDEARAQAARASSRMAQTGPEVITPANSKADFSADVAVIRKRVADAVDAWNRRDAKFVTARAAENHDHINVIGEWRQGKAETDNAMTAALATTRNKQSASIAKIRFITADVAIVITRYQYTNDKEDLKSIATSVLHKMDGEWWNEAFQNTYVRQPESSPLPTPREHRE